MCMSVPQMAVLAISMSTSLGPTFGSGMSLSQIPGAACSFTSAFIVFLLVRAGACGRCAGSANHAEIAPDAGEGRHRPLELLAGQRRGHLGADACLPLRHHRIGEADDVHT